MTTPSWDEATPRIVVGVDGSDGGERALRWAERYAAGRAVLLQLVTACEYPAYLDAADAEEWQDYEDLVVGTSARTQTDLALRTDRSTSAVVTGEAGPVLCAAAKGADLLVVGRRARAHRMALGSVGAYCAHHAGCPVVVVPGPGPSSVTT